MDLDVWRRRRLRETGAKLAVACLVALVIWSLAVLILRPAVNAGSLPPFATALRTASWPLDRAPPTEAVLASGVGDDDFVADTVPATTLAPRLGRLQWLRVVPDIVWTAPSPPVLALYAPYFNRVHVLAPPDYTPRLLSLRDLDFDPGRSRHALVVPLPAQWADDQPVYIAADPARRLPMRIQLESRQSFARGDIAHLRIVLPLLSILAFLTGVVATLSALLRERPLLLLAGTLGSMFLFQGMLLGEIYSMPGGELLAAAGYRPLWTARALQAAFLVLFSLSFLDARKRVPRLAAAMVAASAGMLLVALLAWVPMGAYVGWLSRAGSVLLSATMVMMLAAALITWRQGSRAARFFLLAWLPAMCLDSLRELDLLGWVSLYPDNEYLELVAAIWVAVLFTYGVGDRLVRAGHERDAAVDAARRDSLTGALSRGGILQRMAAVAGNATQPLAVLFADLDRFKDINDRFGHATGDACLTAVTREIRAELRGGDSVGRMGGEEFLVVLPHTDLHEATRIAERIRLRVERACAEANGCAVGLTLSIGVAATDMDLAHDALIEYADAAMYQVKRRGRNGVSAEAVMTSRPP